MGVKMLWNSVKKVGEKALKGVDRMLGEKVNRMSKEFENDLDEHVSREQLTDEDRQMIKFGKESYKEAEKRDKNVGNFEYDLANSNFETWACWRTSDFS
jgi:hypothetical protein